MATTRGHRGTRLSNGAASEAERARAQFEWREEFQRKVADAKARLRVREEASRQLRAERAGLHQLRLPRTPFTLVDDLAVPRAPGKYSVDQLHRVGGNTVITAQYKTGKTTLALNLLKALADGEPFLGQFETALSGRVAFLNYEMSADQLREWCEGIEIACPARVAGPLHLRGASLPFWEPLIKERLADWLMRMDVQALVVDPAARAWQPLVDNENDNARIGQFTDALDALKAEAGIRDLYLTAHTGRARHQEGEERARGATRLEDWADSLWYLTKERGGGGNAARSLRATGRDVELEAIALDYASGTRTLCATGQTRAEVREGDGIQKVVDALAVIFAAGREPPTTSALEDAMEGDRSRRSAWIRAAAGKGYIAREPGPNRSLLCSLTQLGRELHGRRVPGSGGGS